MSADKALITRVTRSLKHHVFFACGSGEALRRWNISTLEGTALPQAKKRVDHTTAELVIELGPTRVGARALTQLGFGVVRLSPSATGSYNGDQDVRNRVNQTSFSPSAAWKGLFVSRRNLVSGTMP